MKYANLIYSDFCRNSAKKLKLQPIDMGYGDPAANKFIPKKLLGRLMAELQKSNAGAYPENRGDELLLEKIAAYIATDEKLAYDYEIATVTSGGRSALTNILASVIDEHSILFIPYPAWSGYKSMARFFNIKIYPIPTSVDNNFVPTGAQVESAIKKARIEYPRSTNNVMILNTPHNPTGTVYPAQAIEEILAVLHRQKVFCIADYTYRAIRNPETVIASVHKVAEQMERSMKLKKYSLTDNIVVLQTFGKVTLTPGFRLGYVSSTSHALIEKFCEKKQATDFGGNLFLQKAFASYFNTPDQVSEFALSNQLFQTRRQAFMKSLKQFGYSPERKNVIVNNSGFYISFRVPKKYKALSLKDFSQLVKKYSFVKQSVNASDYIGLFKDKGYVPASEVFVLDIINRGAVNVLPGHLFCSKNKDEEYENWVRVALIQDNDLIAQAFKRLGAPMLQYS